jgi:hypothetical protein
MASQRAGEVTARRGSWNDRTRDPESSRQWQLVSSDASWRGPERLPPARGERYKEPVALAA